MAIVKSKLLQKIYHSYPYLYKKDLEKFTEIFLDEIKRALRRGLDPGSDIFIHGLGQKNVILHYLFDWTEGCIAVTNKEIEEIYGLVEPGTIIYIYA